MSFTVTKTVGASGDFSTPQLWEDGAPADLTTAEKSAAGTFAVAEFVQGESLTFVGSGATGKFLDTDSTGVGTGSFICYGITAGDPAASDVVTGGTSGATCVLSSSTPTDVGVIWRGEQQNELIHSDVGTVLTMSGSTSSSTAYKHYTAAAGASFRDHALAPVNPLRFDSSTGAAISSSIGVSVALVENFARLSNLQVTTTGSNSSAAVGVQSATDISVDACIMECVGLGPPFFASFGTMSGRVSNSLIVSRGSGGIRLVRTLTGDFDFYNCTMVAPPDTTGLTSVMSSGASGTVNVQNCGLFGGDPSVATNAGSATTTFTNCYGDSSSPPSGVTQVTYSDQFQNVNDATRDFRLKSSADMIDAGVTDVTNAATDIVGTERPQAAAYDVGCWEYPTWQYARPSSDVVSDGWLPSSGSDLYAMLDEAAADDADYIYALPAQEEAELALGALSDPASSIHHIVNYRAASRSHRTVRLGLYDGATLIAEWTDTLTQDAALHSHALSEAEADAITDYTDLRIKVLGGDRQ